MGTAKFRSLLREATLAADSKTSGLLDYRDLQELLKKVTQAAGELLDEHERLRERLRRSSIVPDSTCSPHQFAEVHAHQSP